MISSIEFNLFWTTTLFLYSLCRGKSETKWELQNRAVNEPSNILAQILRISIKIETFKQIDALELIKQFPKWIYEY